MDDQRHAAHATWLVGAGFLVVTVSSAVAVFRGRAAGDTASVAFVVTTYVTLLLLLACLRAYKRAPPGEADAGGRRGRRRIRIRRAVWCLSTLLTVMFASRVAGVMPCWPAALLVWALAAATTIGGFVTLFQPRQ
jgi:hypothetical protein